MKTLSEIGLSEKTCEFIEKNGFTELTPIQEKVIPAVLKGKDVIGLSRTGTGKTHAYLIPLMEKVDSSLDHPYAVITAPTRELAMQIYEKARVMAEVDPALRIKLYTGGTDRNRDLKQLRSSQPHIVIGTPGRIKDLFLNEAALRIDLAPLLIVDEADMTLEYGFLDEIDAFAGRMSESLQMLAFSATMPEQLKPFLKKYMHHPITMRMEEEDSFSPQIRHILVPCYHHTYPETIRSILEGIQPYVCLIFTNTREEAAAIAADLRCARRSVTELHGDLESRKRRQAMKELASGRSTFVVATDIAARGIDVQEVSHIISCGFPEDLSFYIHRAGRTARGGGKGICYALYRESDDASIRSLMKSGIHFEHKRCRSGKWQDLRPYGQRPERKTTEMQKEISRMMTKKNTKVKPGYKKKRKQAIAELERRQRRDFIREKIREEKQARYRQRALDAKKDKS